MTVSARGATVDRTPDFLCETLPYTREEEYVEHYRALLVDVSRAPLDRTSSVACEVSGGLDSSAIFAVAEHLRRQQQLPAPAISGYCLKFEDAPDAEERAYSRAVGDHLGVTIEECEATPSRRRGTGTGRVATANSRATRTARCCWGCGRRRASAARG